MSRDTKKEEKHKKIITRWRDGCGERDRQGKEQRKKIVRERHKDQERDEKEISSEKGL